MGQPTRALPWVRARLLEELQGLRRAVDRLHDIIDERVLPPKGIMSVNASEIMEEVSYETGVSVDEMVGQSRSPDICRARDIAIQRVRERAKLSYPEIGRLFGGRHHTTIMTATRRKHDEPED